MREAHMIAAQKPVLVNDVALRDGHQSLLATRMRIEDILEATKILDDVGYNALEVWGGATFDVAMRHKNEDPWENLRKIKEAAPNTPLMMLLRGQTLVGYKNYPDDVVEAFIERAAINGMNIFRVFDALNDARNLETSIKTIKRLQGEGHKIEAQGTICYTISPVHNVAGFVAYAKELEAMGCNSLCIKDMAGLLTPDAARELITALKRESKLPITLHMHAGMGLKEAVIPVAIEAGIDVVDTACEGMSGGSGHMSTQRFLDAAGDRAPNLNESALAQGREALLNIRPKYAQFEAKYDQHMTDLALEAQVPGGMLSNFLSQIQAQIKGRNIDFDQVVHMVLEEIPLVREEMGWPPLVTPASQIVGVQAVSNVLSILNGQPRYTMMSEGSQALVSGRLGRTPAEPSPALILKAGGGRISHRPADKLSPGLEDARRMLKDAGHDDPNTDDLLSVALYDRVALSFLQNRADPSNVKSFEAAPALKFYFQLRASPSGRPANIQVIAALEALAQNAQEMTRLRHGFYKHLSTEQFDARVVQASAFMEAFGDDLTGLLKKQGYKEEQIAAMFRKIPNVDGLNDSLADRCRQFGVDEDLVPRVKVGPDHELTLQAVSSGAYAVLAEQAMPASDVGECTAIFQ